MGCRTMSVAGVPASSACSELLLTDLYEINMLYRDTAQQLGMLCKSCDSLNTNPLFIEALKGLVLAD